ncbi:hypothetical protein SLA2020_119280 [Shorea laevis]
MPRFGVRVSRLSNPQKPFLFPAPRSYSFCWLYIRTWISFPSLTKTQFQKFHLYSSKPESSNKNGDTDGSKSAVYNRFGGGRSFSDDRSGDLRFHCFHSLLCRFLAQRQGCLLVGIHQQVMLKPSSSFVFPS